MIDSHCHLDLDAFVPDWQSVLESALACGVTRILIPGTTVTGWQRQQMMAAQFQQLDVAFGLHPYFYPQDAKAGVTELTFQLANASVKPVAIGEIGIDGAIDTSLDAQQALFEAQLAVASDFALPVILHHRRSHHLLLESLKRCRFTGGGVVHAFSGSEQQAWQYIEAGFKLGIGGTITYPRASKTRKAVAAIPLEYLLLETDAPDMPIAGRQGKRNSPHYLPEIAEALATLKNLSCAAVSEQTTQNYHQLFGT